ncbi:MAG: Clp protease N-terminal domain-containing protein [Acidimicrobiales bacterium]
MHPRPLSTPRGGCGYLAIQTQGAALQVASELGDTAGPAHLLLAVIDQAEPEAIALLTRAGLDTGAVRSVALESLAAPPDLPPISIPPLPPAGTDDRPPLPVGQLDPRAWGVLCWRQEHLPLRRVHRCSDVEALRHLESKASWRVTMQLGLDEDQRYSVIRHYLARVDVLAAQAVPGLVEHCFRQPGVDRVLLDRR